MILDFRCFCVISANIGHHYQLFLYLPCQAKINNLTHTITNHYILQLQISMHYPSLMHFLHHHTYTVSPSEICWMIATAVFSSIVPPFLKRNSLSVSSSQYYSTKNL